jgi:hypothetical protein
VRSARVKLAAAERKLKDASRLLESGRLSDSEYEAAKADVEVSKVDPNP